MSTRALRQTCPACGARHLATQCHICKTPAISAAERAELLPIYAGLRNERRLSFDAFLADPVLLGCLRNALEARRRARAARALQDPANFELAP